MTPSRMLRPVLACLVLPALGACGAIEADPNRFEAMAQAVADIPLDGAPRAAPSAAEQGLRPAMVSAETAPGDLRVEVLEVHDFWDARDAGLRGAVEAAAPAVIEAAAPMVAHAVVQQAAARMEPRHVAEAQAAAAPRLERAAVRSDGPRTTLQLGAFSSPDAARAAWTRINAGAAVAGLTPAYEQVVVDGRTLTRLKVATTAATARAVCRAADAAQLGCLRRS